MSTMKGNTNINKSSSVFPLVCVREIYVSAAIRNRKADRDTLSIYLYCFCCMLAPLLYRKMLDTITLRAKHIRSAKVRLVSFSHPNTKLCGRMQHASSIMFSTVTNV